MSKLVTRTNDAINANGDHFVNGAVSDIAITNRGSDWYFVRTPPKTPTLMIMLTAILLRQSAL